MGKQLLGLKKLAPGVEMGMGIWLVHLSWGSPEREGGSLHWAPPCPLGSPLFSPGLSAPGHPSSLPQKVGMARPSPAKVPLMVPGLSPSAHETAPTSSGDGSSPLDPGSPQPRR